MKVELARLSLPNVAVWGGLRTEEGVVSVDSGSVSWLTTGDRCKASVSPGRC